MKDGLKIEQSTIGVNCKWAGKYCSRDRWTNWQRMEKNSEWKLNKNFRGGFKTETTSAKTAISPTKGGRKTHCNKKGAPFRGGTNGNKEDTQKALKPSEIILWVEKKKLKTQVFGLVKQGRDDWLTRPLVQQGLGGNKGKEKRRRWWVYQKNKCDQEYAIPST